MERAMEEIDGGGFVGMSSVSMNAVALVDMYSRGTVPR